MIVRSVTAGLAVLLLAPAAHAETLAGRDLASAIREGGLVLLMRHARSPAERPDPAAAEPDNPERERQLDAEGRATAAAMGEALRTLRAPIGDVVSSPAYRARQTVALLGVGEPRILDELGMAEGMAMDRDRGRPNADRLRKLVAQAPAAKTDTLIVTHAPNILAAYPEHSEGLADGETLVLRPDGAGGASLVARVGIEDWAALAAE